MNLALNEPKLGEILRKRTAEDKNQKRHTMSDLTLNEAYRLIAPAPVHVTCRVPQHPNMGLAPSTLWRAHLVRKRRGKKFRH
jgi:hypothetical protein